MSETPPSSARLVLVSYRLPFHIKDGRLVQNSGGLVSAILSYARGQGQNQSVRFDEILWIGVSDDDPKALAEANRDASTAVFTLAPVTLPAELDQAFYNGFCNDLLWPLFHYFPSIADFNAKNYQAYEAANTLFADTVVKLLRPNDTLWIHDYHFFLLPRLVRVRKPATQIGFFLHIPFPSFEVYRLMPREWRNEILEGLLGADMVGFHTQDYVQHFINSVVGLLEAQAYGGWIQTSDGFTRVQAFPIGIDALAFANDRASGTVQTESRIVRRTIGDRTMIFSVDRLDYSKGLLHRLQAFEDFLTRHPEWHDRIVFNMVVVPSRDTIPQYQAMRNEIEAFVGRLNGLYTTLDWRPVVYQYRSLSRTEMIALYDSAEIGLITPMRDGMNLVAKEFVACQNPENPGILILSEMAGAAAELREAILINPNDRGEIADAILRALNMSKADRNEAWTRLRDRVLAYDVFDWAEDFLNVLTSASSSAGENRGELLAEQQLGEIRTSFQRAKSRALFLDYDGTLVALNRDPDKAVPGPHVHNLLLALASNQRNTVAIISGRSREFLDRWFADLPVLLVAEHGAYRRAPGQPWQTAWNGDESWKTPWREAMRRAVSRCPGTTIEDKSSAIVWHYRNAEASQGHHWAQELKKELDQLATQDERFAVVEGNHIVEVRPTMHDKGQAAKAILAELTAQFVLAIGDDTTDEDLFAALPKGGYAIKVGAGNSQARYHLQGSTEVIRLLENLVHADDKVFGGPKRQFPTEAASRPPAPQQSAPLPASLRTQLWTKVKERFQLSTETDRSGAVDTIIEGVEFKGTTVWQLIVAMLIGSIGLNINSVAVIIGALLISPLLGPIMGAGLALGTYDSALLRRSLVNLGLMTGIGLVTSFVYFLISPLGGAKSELLARTIPTFYDVLIAFFGGIAMIIAISRKTRSSNALAGVAVATALIPSLCAAGFGLAAGNPRFFWGALYLYSINTVFIGLATFLFTKYLRLNRTQSGAAKPLSKKQWVLFVALSVLFIAPSIYVAYDVIQETEFQTKVDRFVESSFQFPGTQVLGVKKNRMEGRAAIEVTLVGNQVSEEMAEHLRTALPRFGLPNATLKIIQNTALTSPNPPPPSPQPILNPEDENWRHIGQEVAILFPMIDSFSHGELTSGVSGVAARRMTVLVRWGTKATAEDRQRLAAYLALRLGESDLDIIER